MIVLKFSYHCYSEATRFSHAYIFSPRCKIPHSFENFYNFIYQTTLLSRISCDTISTQNRKLFSTFIVTRKNPFQISFADGIFVLQSMFSYGQRSKCTDLLNGYNIFCSKIFLPEPELRSLCLIILNPALKYLILNRNSKYVHERNLNI